MPFKYKGNINGGHSRTLVKAVLNASTDFRVGDVVTVSTDDGVEHATAGIRVLGVIAAIITDGGMPPSSDGCGGAFVTTYKTAASNETSAKVSALIDVDQNSYYSVGADSTLGTTTGSNKRWYMMDISTTAVTTGASAQTLGESLASATSGQFFSLGLDPEDTTKVLVKIRESFLAGDSGA